MIRAIVVDDELPALNKMVKLLENSGITRVEGKFIKPLEALEFLKEYRVDVVFLDIEMPDMNGIEFSSRILDVQEGIAIVFVTAFNQYAVEAFQLNALDYLMKPVSASRLEETLYKVRAGKVGGKDSSGIHIRCFGKFRVDNGTEEVKFRTEKAEELLAFMIDRRGSFISRREIIDSLWADLDGEKALIYFNTTLHYVKKALLSYGILIPFSYDRGGYEFNVTGLDCDYLKLCSYVEEGKILGQENILQFEEIAGLFTGEYLSSYDYNWVAIKRLLLEERYLTIILAISEYYKSIANYLKAANWMKVGLQREPLHGELNYKLIEVLLLDNNRILALKFYDIYKKNMKKNHGQEPEEKFLRLLHKKFIL